MTHTNAAISNHSTGRRVRVNGKLGTVQYTTQCGWVGVQLDGENRVDEWQPSQVASEPVYSLEPACPSEASEQAAVVAWERLVADEPETARGTVDDAIALAKDMELTIAVYDGAEYIGCVRSSGEVEGI